MGNICRSPAAECFFRKAIEKKGIELQFLIESAGTGGWHAGNPPDRRMRTAAQKQGMDITGSARQITIDDLASFDWIICMDHDNYADVIGMGGNPDATKLFLPFAGIAEIEEVPDPYYGGEDGFDSVITLINNAAKKLATKLT
jgi:protein-tyrosine phosphatase